MVKVLMEIAPSPSSLATKNSPRSTKIGSKSNDYQELGLRAKVVRPAAGKLSNDPMAWVACRGPLAALLLVQPRVRVRSAPPPPQAPRTSCNSTKEARISLVGVLFWHFAASNVLNGFFVTETPALRLSSFRQ